MRIDFKIYYIIVFKYIIFSKNYEVSKLIGKYSSEYKG